MEIIRQNIKTNNKDIVKVNQMSREECSTIDAVTELKTDVYVNQLGDQLDINMFLAECPDSKRCTYVFRGNNTHLSDFKFETDPVIYYGRIEFRSK